jgi:hypothetical protein
MVLWCSLDVLLLRPGEPRLVMNTGDLDAKVKTVFDALRANSVHSRDLAAHREALSLAWPEIVRRLTKILGLKLTAYLAGENEVRALDRWINGTDPDRAIEERLRFAYQVVRTLSQHDSPRVVQAWLTGGQSRAWRSRPSARPARWRRRHHRSEIFGAARASMAGA